ncbi:uncharacterized protein A4U43_C04F17780 [Asparagus officinalis]|uniref:Uncharacterized protein n=1 Tax=Asparagus officinalis TaxID=4686 RepID=A0A5P1F1P7_ASPOF|nr:uncharacterized protein A4U43_C04F17780 [Asparagus officinalis]
MSGGAGSLSGRSVPCSAGGGSVGAQPAAVGSAPLPASAREEERGERKESNERGGDEKRERFEGERNLDDFVLLFRICLLTVSIGFYRLRLWPCRRFILLVTSLDEIDKLRESRTNCLDLLLHRIKS